MTVEARRIPMTDQRGNAIIAALLVVALVATIGGKLLMTQEVWVAQVQARNSLDSAREAVLASLNWARAVLVDDTSDSKVDHNGEAWAQPMAVIALGDISISGRMEDEQAKFDLNSVALEGKPNTPAIAAFARLLATLNLPPSLADALVDWVDSDDETTPPGGAESGYYSGQTPSYRTPNSPLGSLEELLYVRGFDATTIQTLRPFVTVLPTPMTINANTASAEVLAATISSLPIDSARQVVAARRSKHFSSLEDFQSRLTPELREGIQNIGVQSQFFLAHGEAKIDVAGESTIYRISSLLQRQEKKWPLVIWQRPD